MEEVDIRSGTLLIVSHGNNLECLNIVLNILESERNLFHEIWFMDFSDVLYDQDTFHRPLLTLARITSPDKVIFSRLRELGHKVIIVNEHDLAAASQVKVSARALFRIDESVKSALISRSGDELPQDSKWLSKRRQIYRKEGIQSYQIVRACLTNNPQISQIAIFNGRFPCQRGPIEAAIDSNIRWGSYERGSYEMILSPYLYNSERYLEAANYWYAPYPAYDRIEKQEAIIAMDLPVEKIHSTEVVDWFISRRQVGGTNRFTEEWNETSNLVSLKKVAVLFTSSVDEFAELGESWREAEWKDQWAAFEYIIPQISAQDFHIILRVHPNLSNKPNKTGRLSQDAIDQLKRKFPKIEILEATSKINSYALLEEADLAVVWISTIGLEASQMGIRTICLSSSEYDLVADVRRWLRADDVDFSTLDEWVVDPTGAMRFIAGMLAHDHIAKPLLKNYGVDSFSFNKGISLFSNKWAMRNTNSVTNLISILLPTGIFQSLRKIYRRIKFSKFARR